MKNLILFVITITCLNVFSQVDKGSMFAGGALNYYSSTSKNQPEDNNSIFNNVNSFKRSGFGTDINFGFFVADRIAIGPLFTIRQNHQESSYDYSYQTDYSDYKDNLVGMGLFARWYRMTGSEKFGFFMQLSGQYEIGKSSTKNHTVLKTPGPGTPQHNTSYEGAGIIANLSPGFVYFINKRIGLEARVGGIQYQNSRGDSSTDGQKTSSSNYNSFNLNFTMSSFFFGANIYFGGNKTEAPPASK